LLGYYGTEIIGEFFVKDRGNKGKVIK